MLPELIYNHSGAGSDIYAADINSIRMERWIFSRRPDWARSFSGLSPGVQDGNRREDNGEKVGEPDLLQITPRWRLQRHDVSNDGFFLFIGEQLTKNGHSVAPIVNLFEYVVVSGGFSDGVGQFAVFDAFERRTDATLGRGAGVAYTAFPFEKRLAVR